MRFNDFIEEKTDLLILTRRKMVDCGLRGVDACSPRDGLVGGTGLMFYSDTKLYYDLFLPGYCHSAVMDLFPSVT